MYEFAFDISDYNKIQEHILELEDGDVVMIQLPKNMTAEDVHRAWQSLGAEKPKVRIICLPETTILYKKQRSHH